MKGQRLVRALLNGSENIDRMKSEVSQVVRMILGFLDEADRRRLSVDTNTRFVSPSSDFYWSIDRIVDPHGNTSLVVMGFLLKPTTKLVYSGSKETPFTALSRVQIAYENLHVLVDGAKSIFPRLSEKWQPLIDAADVSFS